MNGPRLALEIEEIEILVEALGRAAARLESLAAFRPTGWSAREKQKRAAVMRRLRTRLLIYRRTRLADEDRVAGELASG
jgi:hypothetical protein